MSKPIVSIIMGSDSDLPVMRQAAEMLESFDIPFELTVVSAHRTPDRLFEFSKKAHGRGIRVVIAGAGGAANGKLAQQLRGVLAALRSADDVTLLGNAIQLTGLELGVQVNWGKLDKKKERQVSRSVLNDAEN